MPIVGNAIFEYILKERSSKSTALNIFVYATWPYSTLVVIVCMMSLIRYWRLLVCEGMPGTEGGFIFSAIILAQKCWVTTFHVHHICNLRSLLSRILNTYLSADFIHLREFALSIEKYPMDEKLFAL